MVVFDLLLLLFMLLMLVMVLLILLHMMLNHPFIFLPGTTCGEF